MAYRFYVTDCLKLMCENTANFGGGNYMNTRFADIFTEKPDNDQSAEDIIADVIERAGIEVV